MHIRKLIEKGIVMLAGYFLFGFTLEVENKKKPHFKIQNDSVMIEFDGGYHLAARGKPDIPFDIVRVLLPQGKLIGSYRFDLEKEEINIDYPPSLSSGPTKIDNGNFEQVRDINQGEILCDGYLAGYHIVEIAFYPFEYENGKWLKNSKLILTFELLPDTNRPVYPLPEISRHKFYNEVRSYVVNPEELERYSFSSSSLFLGFQLNSFLSDLHGETPEGIIITSRDMLEPVNNFRLKKLELGVPTVVISTDEISSAFSSGTFFEKLKEVTRMFFALYGINWVLIVGDKNKVPMVTLLPLSPTGTNRAVEGDYYYSALDGNFDSNGDGILGNSVSDDPYPELSIGRIEVSNSAEAQAVLEKILMIQQGAYNLQANKVLFVGGDITRNDGAGRALKNRVENIISSFGGYSFTRLYPTGGDLILNRENFISELASNHFLINHIDHSTDRSLGAGVLNSGSFLYYDDLISLRVTPFLFVSLGCNTSAHIPRSPMNALIKLPLSGAFGYIGFSTQSYSTEILVDTVIFRSLIIESKSLGEAHRKAKLTYSFDPYLRSALTFSGDPSMTIFPPIPDTLTVECPSFLQSGIRNITVVVRKTNGSPVDGAKVVFYQKNNLYKIVTTAATGSANITLSLIADTLYISATKPGTFPAFAKIPVTSSYAPHIRLASYQINDFFGDQNNFPSVGESLGIALRFCNDGLGILNSTRISIISESPQIHCSDSSLLLLSLSPGSCAEVFEKIYIEPIQYQGFATLRLSLPELQLTEHLYIFITFPKVYISNLTRYPQSYPVAGETLTLHIKVKNAEQTQLVSPIFRILPIDSSIEAIDSIFSFSERIRQNDELSIQARVVARREINNNLPVARLTVTDEFSRILSFPIDFQAPIPVNNLTASTSCSSAIIRWSNSSSTDLAGYLVYRGHTQMTVKPLTRSFFVDESVLAGTEYTYVVYAIDSSGNLSLPRQITVSTNPPLARGFPVETDEPIYTSIAAADIDNDGYIELIMTGSQGGVYIIKSDGRNYLSSSNEPIRPFFAADMEIWASPAVGDVNGDGYAEIFVVTKGYPGKAYLLSHTGEIIWSKTVESGAIATPIVADVIGNGNLECIVISQLGKLYIWDSNGNEIRDGDNNPSTDGVFAMAYLDNRRECYSSPAVADINGDGVKDIIFVGGVDENSNGHLYAISANGAWLTGFPVTLDCWTGSSVVIGNLDSDTTTKEIAIAVGQNKLYVFDCLGRVKAGFPAYILRDGNSLSSPALCDIDGDGIDEVFFDGLVKIYGFDSMGRNIFIPIMKPYNGDNSPLIVDVDRDGQKEVVVAGDNKIYAWKLSGNIQRGFPIDCNGVIYNGFTVADVDGNGMDEIVVGTYDGRILVWQTNIDKHGGWFTFRGNFARSGTKAQNYHLQIGLINTSPNSLSGPFPQPFNTVVSIPLPELSSKLMIFNLLGEMVYETDFDKGKNICVWNGVSKNGFRLSSGTYIYRVVDKNGKAYQGKLNLIR